MTYNGTQYEKKNNNHCCTPENNTILQINYTSIKNGKKLKFKLKKSKKQPKKKAARGKKMNGSSSKPRHVKKTKKRVEEIT